MNLVWCFMKVGITKNNIMSIQYKALTREQKQVFIDKWIHFYELLLRHEQYLKEKRHKTGVADRDWETPVSVPLLGLCIVYS